MFSIFWMSHYFRCSFSLVLCCATGSRLLPFLALMLLAPQSDASEGDDADEPAAHDADMPDRYAFVAGAVHASTVVPLASSCALGCPALQRVIHPAVCGMRSSAVAENAQEEEAAPAQTRKSKGRGNNDTLDREDPAYVPNRGAFFLHDDRSG